MKSDRIYSPVTGKQYYPSQAVRIINQLQAAAYIFNSAELLDIYISKDYKTGRPLIVYLFDRESTKPLYELWCKHELRWEEEQDEKNSIS